MQLFEFNDLRQTLLAKRVPGGLWEGKLSASAVATATAICALEIADPVKYASLIDRARAFLLATQNPDGGWGDSPESPSNVTATLLSYASLRHTGAKLEKVEQYLLRFLPSLSSSFLAAGVRQIYGRDLTFSAPILALCAIRGLLPVSAVPRLPFELAMLPRKTFHLLKLPVVSYAIPALIAVGLMRAPKNPLAGRLLDKFAAMQPVNGGFLEAVPLNSFCVLCLTYAGFGQHPAVQKSLGFIARSARPDGSFAIDSNLQLWVTSLSIKALGREAFTETERVELTQRLLATQQTQIHPFNGALPGGWGWTTLPGAVPDGDDTAAALLAVKELGVAAWSERIAAGVRWLMSLQNRDGGIATFCRGWGHLPFDRSCPDISAHALAALQTWRGEAPPEFQHEIDCATVKILKYLTRHQHPDGSFFPLWFGDQNAPGNLSPIFGTAVVLKHLGAFAFLGKERALTFLLAAQNPDGSWGGGSQTPGKVITTALAVTALKRAGGDAGAIAKGEASLLAKGDGAPEPVGLYFAKLWYSEELYPLIFKVEALR